MFTEKIVLAYVDTIINEYKVREFKLLAESLGYRVENIIVQKRERDSRYYFGYGKLNEVKDLIHKVNASKLITYHMLTPIQYMNLKKVLGIEVMDRIQLILEIFNRRAGSKEAKLQIELAKLKLEIPRVREYIRFIKMGEQIGFHGGGEYAIESYYRHIIKRMSIIKNQLKNIKESKENTIIKRKRKGLPEVAITGYTMAGKTTLFNTLTKDQKYRDGKPFATLDTYSHIVDFYGKKAIVTDTIGFIDDLPPLLIESFYATIKEITYADLILFILDASDSIQEFKRKLQSSLKIFYDLNIPTFKILPVLNKIDLISENEVKIKENEVKTYFNNDVIKISAEKSWGIDILKKKIYELLPNYVTILIIKGFENIPSQILRNASIHILDGYVKLILNIKDYQKFINYVNNVNGNNKVIEYIVQN